ncbi:MAG TPA: MFS transporter [Acidimicrobiales bacterium]|nr:MFS transporter [Acidimicrobiales bacterium]
MALSSLQPLRRRNFALIWSAALVSNVGSWMQTVAVGALVTEATGKSTWTGIVAAAAFIPIGIFAPVGGALADRVDRRRYFIGTTIGETFFAALLAVAVATGNAEPWLVTVLVFCGGVLTALGFPAYQAIIPELVPKEELLAAMSLGAAQYNLGRVVGPALAGVAILAGSYELAFAINAASFGAVIVALLLSHFAERPHNPEQTRLRDQIVAGFRGAMAEPGCRLAILLIGITAFLISPFIALIPAVAINLLHEGARGTSVLVTAQGIGAVIGALALTPLANRLGRRRVLVGDLCVLLPATVILYYAAPSLWTAAAALVAVGAAYIGVLSGLMTVVQLRAPEALRARILSLYMVSLGVVYPVGAVLQGKLGDAFGLREIAAGAAALFAGIIVVVLGTRPQRRAVLEEARPAEPEPSVPAAFA